MNNRDDFTSKIKEIIARRVSFICSNPECRSLTLCPSEEDPEKVIYVGEVSHITAASKGGPRYNPNLTSEERGSVKNGIFLCSTCATKIDKNKGIDFPGELLNEWKENHEKWVRENLNKSQHSLITVVNGEHLAIGEGKVTALDIQEPVQMKPGTKAIVKGKGELTATRIAYKKKEE